MLPQRISFQPSVGRSIPSGLLRAMPGHWQLRELAGAYVNGIHCYDSVPSRIIATELRRDVSQDLEDHFAFVTATNSALRRRRHFASSSRRATYRPRFAKSCRADSELSLSRYTASQRDRKSTR